MAEISDNERSAIPTIDPFVGANSNRELVGVSAPSSSAELLLLPQQIEFDVPVVLRFSGQIVKTFPIFNLKLNLNLLCLQIYTIFLGDR